MTHYFFSPHSDDAALSCGGQIAMLTRRGESVVVVTVMAGDSPDMVKLSPHLVELWERWRLGMGAAVSAARRAEDQAGVATLGARAEFWPWSDAVYRRDPANGDFLYAAKDAIFGEISPKDPILTEIENVENSRLIHDFRQRLRAGDTIHSPLSVGGHVDHRLVRHLIEQMLVGPKSDAVNLSFYEEYPYSAPDYKGAKTGFVVTKALDQATVSFNKNAAVTVKPAPTIHLLDSMALDAKIAAIDCYHSQISSFWLDSPSMADSVRRYAQQVGGEREWHFIRDDGSPIPSTSS